jgi:ubiquinone/menaquinone biosynthesis C-methylase UbiE
MSQQQISQAKHSGNIIFSVQAAERVDFPNDYFDLITVSQALHWFEFESFYKEVKRVGKNKGVFAAWSYSLFSISEKIDREILEFYSTIIGEYWDEERKYVDEEYKTIPFPFVEIVAPAFSINLNWSIVELEGYLNTWSAVKKFISQNKINPVSDLIEKIGSDFETTRGVSFPIHLRMGRIEK